jgi:hypothetical protein
MASLRFDSPPAEGATGVAESVRTNTDLEDLQILNPWFGDEQAEELGAALANNKSLKKLGIMNCGKLGARGMRIITEALKTSTVIECLELFAVRGPGDAGAEALADLLVSTSSLQNLSMNDCGIGEIGTTAIANALKTNKTLKVLNISNNTIGDAGGEAFADALAVNSSLQSLQACLCGIGTVGSTAIANALTTNTTLQALAIPSMEIEDAGVAVFADTLAKTKALTQLQVGTYSGIGEEEALALGRAWGSNLALSLDFRLINGSAGKIRDEAVRVRELALAKE